MATLTPQGQTASGHRATTLGSTERMQPRHSLSAVEVLRWLRDAPGQEYRFLASLHAADYLPGEPRFGVHY